MKRPLVLVLGCIAFLSLPNTVFAATLEVSGWMPYWRVSSSTLDVLPHLDRLTEVNPFGYIVQPDGTLNDAAGVDAEPGASFIAAARAKKVRAIPTVMWSDTEAI